MTVFAGLDVHKKYFHATAMDESGDVLVQKDFPNETEGYDSLLTRTGKEVKVAFEARRFRVRVRVGRSEI